MGKLHEVLAVENDLKNAVTKILGETISTFNKKQILFNGFVRTYTPVDREDVETFEPEKKEIEYSVKEKLKYTLKHFERFLNVVFQKECTNTKAKAEIKVDGRVLVSDIPATMLLALEKYLVELRKVFNVAPTLDVGKNWVSDGTAIDRFYAIEKPQYRTKKTMKPVVLHPATKEHPAQVEKVTEDIRAGQWDIKLFSACLTIKQKSDYLEKVDILIRAIKQARARANMEEVGKTKIAKIIFDYIIE